MTLVQSWIDSLTLLKPKNAQLFIMVTLKSIIEAYKILSYYFFVLIVILGICVWSLATDSTLFTMQAGSAGVVLLGLFYQLLLFATCTVTRPSIMKKDRTYFKLQIYALVYVAIILFFIPQAFWPTALSPFYIFLMLFFLDSAGKPKNFLCSMWNALKMVIYNFPLLTVIGICFYVPIFFFYSFVITPLMVQNIIAALLLPIGVCLYANIYIKKLHDQFDLYFPRS